VTRSVTAAVALPTLSTALVGDRGLARATLVIAGALMLTVSAKVQIPLWPVPMTMQTFVVLVIGMAYGTRLGMATVVAYLLVGALGLPVFAGTPEKGVGLPYMLGPTGGYLLGFLIAAALLGKLAEKGWDRGWLKSLGAMTLGHVLILGCGVLWLSASLGVERAVALGLTPFIVATVFKTAMAAVVLPTAWKAIARWR